MKTTTASAAKVKELREKTGAGFLNCQKALSESGGDLEKAVEWLRKKDLARAGGKARRAACEGAVASYIHGGGSSGVLTEVNCETDFAARNTAFQKFVKHLNLHIAAMTPLYIDEPDIPEEERQKEKSLCEKRAAGLGKPSETTKKIAEGMYEKRLAEICLLRQEFVHPEADQAKKETVSAALKRLISLLGENVVIRRFVVFALGEKSPPASPDSEK